MNSKTAGLRVAGAIFGLACLLQVLRLLAGLEILVAGHAVPLWLSAVVATVACALCVWMFRLAHRGGS